MKLGVLRVVFDLVASTPGIGSVSVLQPCHLETCAVLVCIRYPHKSMMFFHVEVAP